MIDLTDVVRCYLRYSEVLRLASVDGPITIFATSITVGSLQTNLPIFSKEMVTITQSHGFVKF